MRNLNDKCVWKDISTVEYKSLHLLERKIKFCYYQCDGYDKNCESYISQSLVDSLKKEK
jgi:hypothetical protein